MDVPMDDDCSIVNETPIKSKAKKLENYSQQEDKVLIAVWHNTSEDAVINTNQKKEHFWERICLQYQDALPSPPNPNRPRKSSTNRFSMIKTKCLKFSTIVQNIEDAGASGKTDQDKLNMAMETFSTEEKTSFKFLHCYLTLRDLPKWKVEVSNNKKSSGTPSSGFESPNMDGSPPVGTYLERPMGRDMAKRKRKSKSEHDSTASSDPLLQGFHDERMAHITRDEQMMEEVMAMKAKKLALDEKSFEATQEWRQEKYMVVNMALLSDLQRQYVERKQKQIFDKEMSK